MYEKYGIEFIIQFNSIIWFAFDYLYSWDAVYKRELQTFQEYGDTGEICELEKTVIMIQKVM